MTSNSSNDSIRRYGLSRLFRVPPQGVGTSQVESLSGYVARIAAEHLVTPSTQLHRELGWWDLGRPGMCGRWLRRPPHLKLLASMNFHESGLRWITLLEKLNGVRGLAACTAISWTRCFPTRGLARPHLAWCPLCLASDVSPYYRLLWCFSDAKTCPVHQCRLMERCSDCHSTIPTIHARTRPGKCSNCDCSLYEGFKKPLFASEDESFNTRLLAEMLESHSKSVSLNFVKKRSPSETLRRCQESVGFEDASGFARLLQVSRITAWYWLSGRSEPTLNHVLRVCAALDLTLGQFLRGEIPLISKPRLPRELPLHYVRKTPKPFKSDVVLPQIKEFLCLREQTPPSLMEVARYVNVEPRVLRRHEPTFCRKISARHLEAVKKAAGARSVLTSSTIEEVVRDKIAHGELLSAKTIAQALPKPGVLRGEKARAVVKRILASPG